MLFPVFMKTFSRIVFSILLSAIVCGSARAQSALDVFGKNRIQHKQFTWKTISTTNFEVYYYQEGNEIAYFAARHAEADFNRIADLLGYTPYSKTKLFIYNSIADLQQSNVGLNADMVLVGGQTNFVKSRVEIPYTGSTVAFKKELSLGIAQIFITEMMFGGSIKDMVQSSYLLSLPEWFISGAASYVAEGWGPDMDDYARDVVVNKNVRKPAVLSGEEARLVGQSIWNYIAERYGKANISNILNLTRIIRNEESSIVSTLGVYPYGNFLKEWRNFYAAMNAPIINAYTMPAPDVRLRKNNDNRFLYNQVKISPNGKSLAYSEMHRGRYRVYVRNLATGRRKLVVAGGHNSVGQRFDEQLPLIGWRNSSQLVVVHVREGEYAVGVYEADKKLFGKPVSRKPLGSFVQIKNFDVSADGKTLVMSGVRKGKNDIFLYDIGRGAVSQVTDDLYDDFDPHFTSESKAFVFSSNRTSDTLETGRGSYQSIADDFDLFAYDPAQSTTVLQRLAATPGNETQATVSGGTIYFLNDLAGIRQVYQYEASSGTARQMTGFRQNLYAYDVRSADSSLAYSTLENRRHFVGYSRRFDFGSAKPFLQTKRSELLVDKVDPAKNSISGKGKTSSDPAGQPPATLKNELVLEPGEVNTDDYQFDADTKRQTAKGESRGIAATVNEAAGSKKGAVQIQGPANYQSRFTTDNAVTSLVIDPLRAPSGLGITFDVAMNEMLEDHKIKAGLTAFSDFASSNFYGEYHYLKRRVDFGARYDKRTYFYNQNRTTSENFTQRYNFHKVQVFASYPVSVASRFTFAPTLIHTRFVETGISVGSLLLPISFNTYGGFKAEYVFDNTVTNGLNMTKGTRIRVKYENYLGLIDSISATRSFNNLNVDIRHYQELHRDIILATRLAYGRFGGRAPKQYLLGGMDNWVFNDRESRPQNDPLTIAQSFDNRDIMFHEFATNMRGFPLNKLSGNSFLLLNLELRIPIVKYFYRGPITSNFFKNLQFVGFSDVGTAWSGSSPFSRDNSLNTRIVTSSPFVVRVTDFRNPFLIGYGAGARTLLFGYYVKFDVAWGVENFSVNPKPRYYLTLGYDF